MFSKYWNPTDKTVGFFWEGEFTEKQLIWLQPVFFRKLPAITL